MKNLADIGNIRIFDYFCGDKQGFFNRKVDKMRSSVLIIYTGGTIGMKRDSLSGALVPFNLDQILVEVPELEKIGIDISTYVFDPLIDSSDVSPENWCELAEIIKDKYNQYDGFVVLHGTDTMAYSASAMSFMIKNLNKPIIFTGSQIPIGEVRTDGKENIITAVEIAGSKINGKAIVPEVAIYFHDQLFRGNRATKYSSESLDAFRSFNYPPLAEVGIDVYYNTPYIYTSTDESPEIEISTNLSSDIAVFRVYPGMSINLLRSTLATENLKGVILKCYGAGNAPSNEAFVSEIKSAINKGITIMNVTQCKRGNVDMTLYATGRNLADMGVVSGNDITLEAALCKMMYLLGKGYTGRELAEKLSIPLRGEM